MDNEDVEMTVEPTIEETPKLLTPVTHDYARVDLNELRDKLNEVISFLNK